MTYKCLIIDDEPLAINVIKNYLAQVKDLSVPATFSNGIDALDYLRETKVDLLFLDINLPILNGIGLLKSLDKKPLVIITTAHEDYAVQSYELEVLDYLVKPISFPRFLRAINKARNKLQEQNRNPPIPEKEFIFIKIDSKKLKKIYLDDILLIESLKDYIKIVTAPKNYIVHQTLSSFTNKVSDSNFIRIHRSYTVAINKIDIIEGNSVEIAGYRYTIGRSYLNEVKERILNRLSDIN
ncbi:LytTR family DNA-binding domain-containing protein [Antarcticibacterium sp. 1MA-6-2]|uniref:LytR/AlgR family response regulator transcription factor n=1 Tax=Antarcticibacterium sp. 1MA-6-2 TaxID=2908210 RepID=UPI001F228F3A|nr:LytTR family DNA-binding domain-containing protein [Antarcticibacterium sp. 1MA-6-2]UJH90717.1 LytTR family DNA-binding domain-containing protein [Antarcticibacterium sp. 1MA-6-2]